LRRVGSTNVDTSFRVSHPLQRTQRMGHPDIGCTDNEGEKAAQRLGTLEVMIEPA
jgi:hypothetical protein